MPAPGSRRIVSRIGAKRWSIGRARGGPLRSLSERARSRRQDRPAQTLRTERTQVPTARVPQRMQTQQERISASARTRAKRSATCDFPLQRRHQAALNRDASKIHCCVSTSMLKKAYKTQETQADRSSARQGGERFYL